MIKELWVDFYRPKTVDECILPEALTNQFKSYLREETIPNLILSGPSGVGKTTVAMAMLNEYDCDYVKINSALKKGIDVIRDEILEFASTVSFKGKKKFVIFDEADGMMVTAQKALNAFIEQFSENCGYIFIVNNPKKIIPEIHSRCQMVNFVIPREEIPTLAMTFYGRLEAIFAENNIVYNKQVVGPIIKRCFPDWRQMLITFQGYAIIHKGNIDAGILGHKGQEDYSEIILLTKAKRWEDMRKWVGENPHIVADFGQFAVKLSKELENYVDPKCKPDITMTADNFDCMNYFSSDRQLHATAFLTKLMTDLVWK